MENKIKKARQAYERDIPTNFSAIDKQAVLERITAKEKGKQEKWVAFIPKTLTFVAVAALVIFFVNNINFPFSGTNSDGAANNTAANDGSDENSEVIIDKDSEEEEGFKFNWGEDVKVETYQTSIELSPELKSIYKEYSAKHNDMVLQNLSPLDVFRMYFHANNLEDAKTVFALYIKGEKYGSPSEEEYFGDPEFWGANFTENDRKLYESLLTVEEFNVAYLNEEEAVVTWVNEDNQELAFRLIKDTTNNQSENGIWKIAWLAMQ